MCTRQNLLRSWSDSVIMELQLRTVWSESRSRSSTSARDSSSNPTIAFRTALWFWVNNVRPVLNQGFGATIRAINGDLECNGKSPDKVNARIRYYRDYCGQLGVDPGPNLSC